MTVDGVEPAGHFETERCGKRLLHPGAGRDERLAILECQFAESDGQEIEFGRDQRERLAQLKDASRVDGVLAGGAPMDITSGFFIFLRDENGELFDERNCEI